MRNPVATIGVAIALCLMFTGVSMAQTGPTGNFNYSTQINSNGTLTPTLTWSTTPAATSCVASGDAAWSGTKGPSGTQTLAAFPNTVPKTWALVCNWPGVTQVLLTWTPPVLNTDGSALTNLAGHRVSWGTSATALSQVAQVPSPANSYTVSNLTAGNWYFAVRAYTAVGMESDLSNVKGPIALTGPIEWSHSVGVKKPQAPVLE